MARSQMSSLKSQIWIDAQGRIYERQPRQWPLVPIMSAVVLVLAVAASAIWLHYIAESARSYRPPVTVLPEASRETTPIVQQVVLVIVDGLRVDMARQMPLLGELRAQGASAVVRVPEPTFALATWTTLVTGAGPELNSAPLLNVPADQIQPIAVDHLFERAKDAGLATGLFGYAAWEKLIPASFRDVSFFADTPDAQTDARITEAAVGALKAVSADLLVIHLGRVDAAGHEHGASSPEYFDAVLATDQRVHQIASATDLNKSVLIITANHGHLNLGGHGGAEPEVAIAPFVMVGQGVVSGEFGTIDQTDIAPTIAVLLGTAIPAAAQGAPRFEMLQISEKLRAEKALAAGAQHLGLAEAYLGVFPDGELENTISDERESLRIAQTTDELGNHADGFKLAFPTVSVINETLAQLRAERIAAEQGHRQWPALILTLLPLAGIWVRRSFRTGWLLAAALLAFLFPLGNAAMWNSLGGLAAAASDLGQRIAAGLLVASVCVLTYLWWRGDRRSGRLVAIMLLAGLTVAAYFGLLARPPLIYSLSAIRGEGAFFREILGRSLMALGLGSVITLAGLWWEDDVRFWPMICATYGFVLLLLSMLIAALAITAWQIGFGPTWYLPDMRLALLQACLLVEMGFVAGIGLILPVFTVAAGFGLYTLSRRIAL